MSVDDDDNEVVSESWMVRRREASSKVDDTEIGHQAAWMDG